MTPHSYQNEAVAALFTYFVNHAGNPLIAMPTGTGKSVVIGEFLRQVFHQYPHTKVLMLTHRKDLVRQNAKRLLQMWPQAPLGINSAGLKQRDVYHPIIFAGIGSVHRKPEQFGKVDLIIVDEAHTISDKETTIYRKFVDALNTLNPVLKIIGLTATPFRNGVGCLTEGGLFTDICFDLTTTACFHRFIAEGYMSMLVPKRMKQQLDVSGVHMQNGDFKLNELQLAVDKEEITRAALQEALQYGADRKKWLIFASGIEHADHIAQMLNEMGISCEAFHSKISEQKRDQILLDFELGNLRAVVNNDCLTTGFDNPAIDLLIILRPTTSVGLWIQILGRGTRALYAPGYDLSTQNSRLAAIKAGGKANTLVLDFARNTARLGPINDPILPRKKGNKGGTAPVKACPMCETYNHISARECFNCGHTFVFETKIVPTSSNEALISSDLPEIIEMKVDEISYSQNVGKNGKPNTFRVLYQCGLNRYNEHICLEHAELSYANNKAKKWWNEACQDKTVPPPKLITVALAKTMLLRPATHIRVWINKKPYPQVMARCYDGSFFGKEAIDPFNIPSMRAAHHYPIETIDDYDDDIPF